MRVSGFTFIRNAVKLDYPVGEAIKSILPVCDDFIVAVGNSEDDTVELVRGIDPKKIKVINTIWNNSPEQIKKGEVFAEETNKAFQAVPMESDWAFYIQGDEAVHEKYLDSIRRGMEIWRDDKRVDGLLFSYLHFYGSYDYVGNSPRWYDNEIRIIRNDKAIYSYRDAQGFRKGKDEKLCVKPIDACMFHYGWVRDSGSMMTKLNNTRKFYRELKWLDKVTKNETYDFTDIDSLVRFTGTHPEVMKDRIKRKNWSFDFDVTLNRLSLRYRTKFFLRKYLGIDTFYENYRVI